MPGKEKQLNKKTANQSKKTNDTVPYGTVRYCTRQRRRDKRHSPASRCCVLPSHLDYSLCAERFVHITQRAPFQGQDERHQGSSARYTPVRLTKSEPRHARKPANTHVNVHTKTERQSGGASRGKVGSTTGIPASGQNDRMLTPREASRRGVRTYLATPGILILCLESREVRSHVVK